MQIRQIASVRSMTILFASTMMLMVLTQSAQAQTYTVLHNFTGGADGAYPYVGLTPDAAGNLYGTTYGGRSFNNGTVFKLRRSGSGWVLLPLYSFAGGSDGSGPESRVAIAHDGSVYGTTFYGGGNGCGGGYGCGTVFRLQPPVTAPKSALSPWTETLVHRFAGGGDEAGPQGDLTFDQAGNMYGTTTGDYGYPDTSGTVYKLTPAGSGWTEAILYATTAGPSGGVILDRAGNLYGVLTGGGLSGYGAVYELSPAGENWLEQTLYSFTNGSDGGEPAGGLIIDASSALYGTTQGGALGDGTAFTLTPANGSWTLSTLYSFPRVGSAGPLDKLLQDAAGNLYGTLPTGGAYGNGAVFKLSPSDGGWAYTSLHDFTGGDDGAYPLCVLVSDANGNLYGTTSQGGTYNYGVVWEITP